MAWPSNNAGHSCNEAAITHIVQPDCYSLARLEVIEDNAGRWKRITAIQQLAALLDDIDALDWRYERLLFSPGHGCRVQCAAVGASSCDIAGWSPSKPDGNRQNGKDRKNLKMILPLKQLDINDDFTYATGIAYPFRIPAREE